VPVLPSMGRKSVVTLAEASVRALMRMSAILSEGYEGIGRAVHQPITG
jgi:hypothetical protein